MKVLFKQISTLLFLMYYVVISSGINISLHYCEGELSDIAIITHNTYCQMHDSDSCEGNACANHLDKPSRNQCELETQHQCCDNTDVYLAFEIKSIFSESNFSIESQTTELINIDDDTFAESADDNSNYDSNNERKLSYPPPYLAFHKLILYA